MGATAVRDDTAVNAMSRLQRRDESAYYGWTQVCAVWGTMVTSRHYAACPVSNAHRHLGWSEVWSLLSKSEHLRKPQR